MAKHSRFMVLGLAVLALALVTTPAMAANTFTINETDSTGIAGTELFVPTFISMNDPSAIGGTFTQGGIYIPYLGTMTTCTTSVGFDATGDCAGWASASIVAWANGLYYDPRFGTPFIPPSGDHHRAGYRMLMQPSFSGGQWASGFAQLAQEFPFFPTMGQVGAGGDIGLAMANASFEAGMVGILNFLDGHGEPLTTGKFPRYWPHDREAWADTLMVKYTAGGGVANVDQDLFAQNLRTEAGLARNATDIRWRAMSNIDGAFSLTGGASSGCGGTGWCEFYVTEDTAGNIHLFVVQGADGNTDTEDGAPVELTQSTRKDTVGGLSNNGQVLKLLPLSNLAKLPFVVDQRASQYVTESGCGNAANCGGEDEFQQQLVYQFRVVSGPNVHSEEGADPYAWVICGTRGSVYGEEDCAAQSDAGEGAIDADGHMFAIVYTSNGIVDLGESPLSRIGSDLSPRRVGNTLYPQLLTDSLDPDTLQNTASYVECVSTGAAASQNEFGTSTCESDPGADGLYGTSDDGTIYYREAIENGLRGWIRETDGHAFSFLGADTDGTHNGASPANFGLSQIIEQTDPVTGALLSCLQCSPHDVPIDPQTVTYSFHWPGLPEVTPIGHFGESGLSGPASVVDLELPVLP